MMNESYVQLVIVSEKQRLIDEAFRHVLAIESILSDIDKKISQKKK